MHSDSFLWHFSSFLKKFQSQNALSPELFVTDNHLGVACALANLDT